MLTRSLAAGNVKDAQALLQQVQPARSPGEPAIERGPIALPQAAPGAQQKTPTGTFWLIRRNLEDVSTDYVPIQKEYAGILRGARQRFDELEASAAMCHIADGQPEGPLFMDLETCGLAGSIIFLVGLMSFQGDQLVFEQFLARHYGEEPAILSAFADRLASASSLVTFNGKAFDMTSLRERSAFHGVDLGIEPPHCDLLHESRRRWRRSLPNCKLQTLEEHLCGRRRVGDIPGAQIPEAYHRFVSGGNARQLQAILHHNLLDLLTMSQLLCAALTGEQPNVST